VSVDAPKTPWKPCVFGRESVTFRAEYAKNKAGPKRGGNANRALTRSNGYGAFKMDNRFYRQGRIPASETNEEYDAFPVGAAIIEGIERDRRSQDYADHLRSRCRSLGMSEEMTLDAIDKASAQIALGLPLCESPIEEDLLPWMVCEDYGPLLTCPARVHSTKSELMPPNGDIFIVPQFVFAKYRLDFAVIAKCPKGVKIIAVECDGKEFHKDRDADGRRNSYLRMFGIDTIRATGAEIKRRPRDVSFRVASAITEWAVAP
jgi:hypothetical protein